MKATEFITEALLPSQYRKYVQGWDKSRWADIFGGKYRIYLELDGVVATKEPQPNPQVIAALNQAGYEVSDYKLGLAYKQDDPRKQQVRIGKILSDTRLNIPPNIKLAFDRDPVRQSTKSDKLVVISRHPYDIAGMSTERGWSSCMNLHNGVNRRYVAIDVKKGTIIAYLINRNDLNIQKPIARVLIKPFLNIKNKKEIALGVESNIYGTAPLEFEQTVEKWANNINASKKLYGVFTQAPGLYDDNGDEIKIMGVFDNEEENIKLMKSSSKDNALTIFRHITPDKLTEKMCLVAVQKNAEALQSVPDELKTEKICLAAVQNNGWALQFVPDELKTEKICLAAVQDHGLALQSVPDELKTEKICLAAVQNNGWALQFVPRKLKPIIKQKAGL